MDEERRILLRCPDKRCPVTRVPVELVELRVGGIEDDWYQFICPTCWSPVKRFPDWRLVQMMKKQGVVARFNGPPLERDEILNMHHILQSDDNLDAVWAELKGE